MILLITPTRLILQARDTEHCWLLSGLSLGKQTQDSLGGLGVLSATGGEKKIDPPQFINPGMVLKFALSLSSRCLPDQV